MPTSKRARAIAGTNVYLRPPRLSDAVAFLRGVQGSGKLHRNWVKVPETPRTFTAYVRRYAQRAKAPHHAGFLVLRRTDDALVGAYNFSEIVHGAFESAYLGYYAFVPLAAHGYMTEGLRLALDMAYRKLRLHRIEVNIQPSNLRSVALVERVGFTCEGYSRRYVKIAGRWRDHVRYAMLAEDWRELRSRRHSRGKLR